MNAMQIRKWPPLDRGTRVMTLRISNPSDDWSETAKAARKFGVFGVIRKHYDSHGLCYQVMHEDGTLGYYEPRELRVLKVKKAGKIAK